LIQILDTKKSETLSNNDFIYLMNKVLSKEKFTNDSRYDELRKTWLDIEKISFDKQDKIIKEALENNRKKFETVKSIINNEKLKNKKLKEELKLI
jgi:hypothetical protein